MAQWTKVSATKPDNLFSVPRTHMVEGIDCPKLSFDLHMPLPPSQIKKEGNRGRHLHFAPRPPQVYR